MAQQRRLAPTLIRSLALLAAVLASDAVRAAEMEFCNVPLLVNAYPGSGMTEAEAKDAVKRVNEIYKDAKVRFTLKAFLQPGANPGDGNGSWTLEERDTVRADGAKELRDRIGKDKGVKVSVAVQPKDSDADINGLSIVANPTAVMRENANGAEKTAQTMAHEIGHILSLDDLENAADKDRLMYGYSDRTDVDLTDAEKAALKAEAKKRGKTEKTDCPPGQAVPPSQPVPKGTGYGSSTVPSNATPNHALVRSADMTLIDPNEPRLELRFYMDDRFDAQPPFEVNVLLDTDSNPATGQTHQGQPGIDRIIQFFVLPPSLISGGVFDGDGAFVSGIDIELVEPRQEVFGSQDPNEPLGTDPAKTQIRIEVVGLDPGAGTPIVVSGDLVNPPLDLFPIEYSPVAHTEGPQASSTFGEVDGDAPDIDITLAQFDPFEMVDVFLDDDLVTTLQVDGAGAFTGPLSLPGPLPAGTPFFVTAQGQNAGDFGYFVVMTTAAPIPTPALPGIGAGAMAILLLLSTAVALRRGRAVHG